MLARCILAQQQVKGKQGAQLVLAVTVNYVICFFKMKFSQSSRSFFFIFVIVPISGSKTLFAFAKTAKI